MNTPKSPSVPTLSAPTAPSLPANRNGKSNDSARKAEFLGAIQSAFDGWNKGRDEYKSTLEKAQKKLDGRVSSLSAAVRAAKDSGLFTDAELIEAVKGMAISAGYTPQAASHALVSAGLRQRAVRKDSGTKKGGADTAAEKGEEAPATTPAPAPAPAPTDNPMEFATTLAKRIGKDAAMKWLSTAFQSLAVL